MEKYTPEQLKLAIEDVREGGSLKIVSKLYGIPRTTLQSRLTSKVKNDRRGPPGIFTAEEETKICLWMKDLLQKGFPIKKGDIQLSIQQFLNLNPRPNTFVDNCPGQKWVHLFLKRHPEVVQGTCELESNALGLLNENDTRKWFKKIEEYLTDIGHFHVLDDPTRVFIGNETSFRLYPEAEYVPMQRGAKNISTLQVDPEKESITCRLTFSANGESTPPMVIFPYQRLPKAVAESVPLSWGIGRTEWVQSKVFFEYISNVFYPYIINMKIQFPVILFLDRHKTHLTLEMSELCAKLNIILVAIYPNSFRIMHPVMEHINDGWKAAVMQWRAKHSGQFLTKTDFCPLLLEVLNEHLKVKNIGNAFQDSGLYPWNEDAPNYSNGQEDTRATSNDARTDASADTGIPAVCQRPQLNYATFCNIVGEEILNDIQECQNGFEICNPYLKKLVEIWKFFNSDINSFFSFVQFNTSVHNAFEVIEEFEVPCEYDGTMLEEDPEAGVSNGVKPNQN